MRCLIIVFSTLVSLLTRGQTIDTLVNVGKYSLHFTIISGNGVPILFEAGGGNDGGVWSGITPPIATVTGATVITYDRPGLGKSGKDSTDMTIENDIRGLETGLRKLGFQKQIMLVSHSLGGFYNTLYASRHPADVTAVVFIDVNLPCFFTSEQFKKMNAPQWIKDQVQTVINNPLPSKIPVTDIVSEKTLFEGTPDAERWKACHRDFVAASPNRKELIALETGHYVFRQNRQLVINAIVTMYANHVMPSNKAAILERGYMQASEAYNDDRKELMHYWHSEDDLNEWGYTLMRTNEFEKSIEVFKLNVALHPESANVFDSLGDGYTKTGNKELAIENYKKALTLDPAKKSTQKKLEQLMR
jgi:hypothetical protein